MKRTTNSQLFSCFDKTMGSASHKVTADAASISNSKRNLVKCKYITPAVDFSLELVQGEEWKSWSVIDGNFQNGQVNNWRLS